MRLGEILTAHGLATKAQIETALARQQQAGGHIGATLISMGVLSIEELLDVLKYQSSTNMAVKTSGRTVERWTALFGPTHPNTLRARTQLARAMLAVGRAADAATLAESALADSKETIGLGLEWTRETAQIVADANRDLARAGAPVRARNG